jgi:transglutaminase-like putative cysteine protease
MRLSIKHTTTYRYDGPVTKLVQAVRLTPVSNNAQQVLSWQVTGGDGRALSGITDSFGNIVQLHAPRAPGTEVVLSVSGTVETTDTNGIIKCPHDILPPVFFTAPSEYTAPDAAIMDLAQTAKAEGTSDIDMLHKMMNTVRDRVAYIVDVTNVSQTAADVLAQGSGVCQDHAHIMIAAARYLDFPARYVSGYLWTPDQAVQVASHAWMEVLVPDVGWLGFDAANRVCPDDKYVRLACGRDYTDAAPVRGVRTGGATEVMDVRVQVTTMSQQ